MHVARLIPLPSPPRNYRKPIEEIDVSGNLSINDSEMLRAAIQDGIGIAVLADRLVRDQIAAGPMGVGAYADWYQELPRLAPALSGQ